MVWFIGSHLAERLLDMEINVVGLDNFVTGSPGNLADLQGCDGFRLLNVNVNVNVTDYISVPRAQSLRGIVPGPLDDVLHSAHPASRSTTSSCPSRP